MASTPRGQQTLLAQIDSVLSQVQDRSGSRVLGQFCPHPFPPHLHVSLLSAITISVQQGTDDVSSYAERLDRCIASITYSTRIADLAFHANRLSEAILVASSGESLPQTREASAAADVLLAALAGIDFSIDRLGGLEKLFANVTEKVTPLFSPADIVATNLLKQSISECRQCLDDIQFALAYQRQLAGIADELRDFRSAPNEIFTKKLPAYGIEWASGSGGSVREDADPALDFPDDDEALSLEHLEPYFAVQERRAALDDLHARIRRAPSDPSEVRRLLEERDRLLSELSSLQTSDK
jgi:hypothetical protein